MASLKDMKFSILGLVFKNTYRYHIPFAPFSRLNVNNDKTVFIEHLGGLNELLQQHGSLYV